MEIVFGNALDFGAHRGGEEQRVALSRHAGEDFVDAFREAHVEHFVGFVKHDVFNGIELCHTALHEVDQAARSGHDDLGALAQGANLAFDARTAIDGEDVEVVDISGIFFQVASNLQTQLTRGTENNGLRATVVGIDFLQNRQTVGGRFPGSRLGQGDDIVADS